jgi:hypothetical protein
MAILAAIAFSPNRAAAECGDYVHIGQTGPDGLKLPVKPCDGPHCSQKPATPAIPLTLPTTESEGAKTIAALAAADGDGVSRGQVIVQRAVLLPDPIPTSIFHPPRSV